MLSIKFTIVTLFPEALRPYLESSMLWKAQDRGIIAIDYVNLRDFGLGPHKSVDDTPYGGGDGMLLRCEPIFAAVETVRERAAQNGDPVPEVILPTPAGQLWDQQLARQFAGVESAGPAAETPTGGPAKSPFTPGDNIKSISCQVPPPASCRHYLILCPHYEGYDQRILTLVDYQISLGHYILTGGELPALIIIDSITRLLPGVLGGATSAEVESFSDGDNLEYPQYTKPYDFRGMTVPEVLLSGNHGEIARWRQEHSRRVG